MFKDMSELDIARKLYKAKFPEETLEMVKQIEAHGGQEMLRAMAIHMPIVVATAIVSRLDFHEPTWEKLMAKRSKKVPDYLKRDNPASDSERRKIRASRYYEPLLDKVHSRKFLIRMRDKVEWGEMNKYLNKRITEIENSLDFIMDS
jgi:hypothetical protein